MNNFLIKDNDGEFKVLDKKSGDISSIPKKVEDDQAQVSASPVTSNQQTVVSDKKQKDEKVGNGQQAVISPNQKINLNQTDDSDAKDVAQHDNASQRQMNDAMNAYILDLVRGIVQDLKLNFSDNSSEQKFQKIVFTVVRGARKIAHIKELLPESKKHFGVEITKEHLSMLEKGIKDAQVLVQKKFKMMRKMMNNSGEKKQALRKEAKENKKTEGLNQLRKSYAAEDYTVNSLVTKKAQKVEESKVVKISQDTKDTKKPDKAKAEQKPQKDSNGFTKQPTKYTDRVDQQRIPTQGRTKVSLEKQTVKIKPPANPILVKKKSDKTSMVDIVPPQHARAGYDAGSLEKNREETVDTRGPKLSGPVDELRHMTVIDFRRLSDDIEQRLSKLEEKIHLLEERSYIDRIKGVQAWQASPLYKLYVQIGYQALLKNVPLETIINSYTEAKQDTLTLDEFVKLGSLNHKLSF